MSNHHPWVEQVAGIVFPIRQSLESVGRGKKHHLDLHDRRQS